MCLACLAGRFDAFSSRQGDRHSILAESVISCVDVQIGWLAFAKTSDTGDGFASQENRSVSRSHVGMFETLPTNPNAFQAAKPLRVTDPRSALPYAVSR